MTASRLAVTQASVAMISVAGPLARPAYGHGENVDGLLMRGLRLTRHNKTELMASLASTY